MAKAKSSPELTKALNTLMNLNSTPRDKAVSDAATFGQGFTQGGKHVPLSAVYSNVISEPDFARAIRAKLEGIEADCVMGPGRSGAVAAVYASHILGIPFIPCGQSVPANLPRLLIIDTATETGKTLRKMERRYPGAQVMAVYHEPPRVMFWYEAGKPQRYRHQQSKETVHG